MSDDFKRQFCLGFARTCGSLAAASVLAFILTLVMAIATQIENAHSQAGVQLNWWALVLGLLLYGVLALAGFLWSGRNRGP